MSNEVDRLKVENENLKSRVERFEQQRAERDRLDAETEELKAQIEKSEKERAESEEKLKRSRVRHEVDDALLAARVIPGALEAARQFFLDEAELELDDADRVSFVRFGGGHFTNLEDAIAKYLSKRHYFVLAEPAPPEPRGRPEVRPALHELSPEKLWELAKK